VVWALASAVLILAYGWALTRNASFSNPYGKVGPLLASVAYLGLAVFLLVTGSFALTHDYPGWRTNLFILSLMVVIIGILRLTLALEAADATKVAKAYGRRWAIGMVTLLCGSFLIILGIFAYTYTDLVEVPNYEVGLGLKTWGFVYRDEAYVLLGFGAILSLLGAILLISGWKARPCRIKTGVLAAGVVGILLVEILAAMLIVNPGALDMGSNRWEMKPGDYYRYESTSIQYSQNKNHTTGELVNFTTGYLNITFFNEVLEVTGRSEIYMGGLMEVQDFPPIISIYKMPKDAQRLGLGEVPIDLHYLRDETVTTPWGPRVCERLSGTGYVSHGSCSWDEWVRDGIVVMTIADYRMDYYYDEPKEYAFRHEVTILTDTSLEEVTEGQSDPGGPPVGAWAPAVGDALNYTWSSTGSGQDTTWRYLIKEVASPSMLVNLTITSMAGPNDVITSGESWRSTENTTLGISLYPATSQGLYSVMLVGNESISTPWGQLECSHYCVTHVLEDSDTFTREDLYVRNGVLLKLESFGLGQYSMTLAETNLELG